MLIVDVIHPDGRSTRHPIAAAETMVGTSPDAAITIAGAPELEPFHLLISPRTGGAWVSVARGARTQATVAGQKFENGVVTLGSELDVGSVTLRIDDASRDASRSLRTWAILAALVGGGVWVFAELGARDQLPRTSAEPPALFTLVAGCPDAGDAAARRAHEAAEMANAKARRYPYAAQDGIEGVDLWSLAEACYRAAGQNDDALRAAAERERMSQKIEEDYQVHRLRLDRALKEGTLRDLLTESRALFKMVQHRPGPYREWLVQLARHVEVRLEQPPPTQGIL